MLTAVDERDRADAIELLTLLVAAAHRGAGHLRPHLPANADVEAAAVALRALAGGEPFIHAVGVNELALDGPDVGIDLRAADGRWWRVNLLGPRDERPRVRRIQVFERPPVFPGRPGGLIVCLGGASSAGKSSLMVALSERAGTPWTRFDEMVPGQMPIRYLIWRGAAGPLREGFLAAVAALASAGNQVIMSARPAADVRAAFQAIPTVFARLVCPLDVLVARQASRPDRWAGLAEETHAADQLVRGYDLEIDTSANSPEEAADILLDHLERLRPEH
jgi:chloramphenicol 3-O phosphotransferase